MKAPKVERNEAARSGQRASVAVLFGDCSRFAAFAVHTRFEAVTWFVTDAEQVDAITGMPAVIRQADTFLEAIAGLEGAPELTCGRSIAGADLRAALFLRGLEVRAALPAYASPRERDAALCAEQVRQERAGFMGVELVETVYGWSVRYDSGLRNFGLLAGGRRGDIDGTLEAAENFARDWVDVDPAHRYAWTRGRIAELEAGRVACPACATHYGDGGPCDLGLPQNSPHRGAR